MVGVVRAIQQEHANMATLLDLVLRQADKAGDSGGPDLDLLKGIADYCLVYPDNYHHPKEDLIYQAMCRHDRTFSPAVGDLLAEHVELRTLTREFADAVDQVVQSPDRQMDWFLELCRSFVAFYRRHMDKEERHFLPEALKLLAPEEWDEIEDQITDPTDPLFNDHGATRLISLRRHIADTPSREHSG